MTDSRRAFLQSIVTAALSLAVHDKIDAVSALDKALESVDRELTPDERGECYRELTEMLKQAYPSSAIAAMLGQERPSRPRLQPRPRPSPFPHQKRRSR